MIERVKFGTTKEGTEASIYILENGNYALQHQLEIYSDKPCQGV